MHPSIYHDLSPDFFDSTLRSPNPITRYYHRNRYEKIRRFISARFCSGMRILDLGCGSSSWNVDKLPVTGFDQNEGMLQYGKKKGYIGNAIVGDLERLPLPFDGQSFDFVVLSEVLEHLDESVKTIKEASRVLKKGGFLIITVPLDTDFSPWRMLFGLNCIFLGDILNNQYYKERCGHVRHFSVESLSRLLEDNGFRIVEKDITILNIGILARR